MTNCIAIDLGGTNLRVARINTSNKIEEVIKIESEIDKGIDILVDKIIKTINTLKNEKTTKVGLSVPGQVDNQKGIIITTTNIPFSNYPIRKMIKDKCNLEAVLNNDANVAGLGEAVIGAGKNDELVYYITWSTGIGGALIVNKKLISGNNMYSGEVGNIVVDPQSQYIHSHMTRGAVEGLASGTALKRHAEELGYENVKNFIEDYGNSEEVRNKIDYIADKVAQLLTTIYHVIEIDKFVIGGGVTFKSGKFLLPLVEEKLNHYLMPVVKNKIKISVAELGDDAGLYGAGLLTTR